MRQKLLKGGLVVCGAVLLSTVGIFAADKFQGINPNIGGLASVGSSVCPSGMVPLSGPGKILCVDTYEASASDGCKYIDPSNLVESENNANNANCLPVSKQGVKPWRFISLPQAQRMCARAGKRLPTSDEWYRAVLGTDPASCNVDSRDIVTTGSLQCKSSINAYDLVGNLWEWVNETVVNGNLNDRQLPSEGYVSSVDASGLAITTDLSPNSMVPITFGRIRKVFLE